MSLSYNAFVKFGWMYTYPEVPFGLGTTTMLAVGYSTLVITPIASTLSSSCFTFGIRGNGILLGVEIAKGLAPS